MCHTSILRKFEFLLIKGGWGELWYPQKTKRAENVFGSPLILYTYPKNYLKNLVWEDRRRGAGKHIYMAQYANFDPFKGFFCPFWAPKNNFHIFFQIHLYSTPQYLSFYVSHEYIEEI